MGFADGIIKPETEAAPEPEPTPPPSKPAPEPKPEPEPAPVQAPPPRREPPAAQDVLIEQRKAAEKPPPKPAPEPPPKAAPPPKPAADPTPASAEPAEPAEPAPESNARPMTAQDQRFLVLQAAARARDAAHEVKKLETALAKQEAALAKPSVGLSGEAARQQAVDLARIETSRARVIQALVPARERQAAAESYFREVQQPQRVEVRTTDAASDVASGPEHQVVDQQLSAPIPPEGMSADEVWQRATNAMLRVDQQLLRPDLMPRQRDALNRQRLQLLQLQSKYGTLQ